MRVVHGASLTSTLPLIRSGPQRGFVRVAQPAGAVQRGGVLLLPVLPLLQALHLRHIQRLLVPFRRHVHGLGVRVWPTSAHWRRILLPAVVHA